jgi:hypothetical protein
VADGRIIERVRRKLRDMLAREVPPTVWAGSGLGGPCATRDLPHSVSQVEYEVVGPGAMTNRFHLGCYVIWVTECRRPVQVVSRS